MIRRSQRKSSVPTTTAQRDLLRGAWNSTRYLFKHYRSQRVVCALALFVAGIIGILDATPASATGTWSSGLTIDGTNTVQSVSCPSSTFCAAVDNVGNATFYNGSSWTSPTSIDTGHVLVGVSCPTTTFCVAVDNNGHEVISTNGSTWAGAVSAFPGEIMSSVSCSSASNCAATDRDGEAWTTTNGGANWTSAGIIDGSGPLQGVSCATSSFCAAVGTGSTGGNGYIYTGSWSATTNFASNALTSVSCASSSFCLAVGPSGLGYAYTGSWSSSAVFDGTSNTLNSTSCTSSSFCMAVDSAGNVYNYPGTWAVPSTIDASHALESVSCPSSNFCVAVDNNGQAFTYTNSSPTPSPTPSTPQLGNPAPMTLLVSSLNPATVAQAITFTASVLGTNATGTVSFYADSATLGSVAVTANEQATVSTSTLNVGSHTVVAIYSGDSHNLASASSYLTEVINQAPVTPTVPSPTTTTLPPPAPKLTLVSQIGTKKSATINLSFACVNGPVCISSGELSVARIASLGSSPSYNHLIVASGNISVPVGQSVTIPFAITSFGMQLFSSRLDFTHFHVTLRIFSGSTTQGIYSIHVP